MRKLLFAVALAAALLTGGTSPAATQESSDGDAVVLSLAKPAWLTPALEARIDAAGLQASR